MNRRGADERWPRPQRRLEYPLRSAASKSSRLSAKSRRDVIPQELLHLNGPNFLGTDLLLFTRDAVFWDVSSDFLRFRKRTDSSSSNCFEVGSFSFFKNISCVLSRKRHSSGKSPVAHLRVIMSSSRNKRFFWPNAAKETTASRCSCRSPVEPGELIGDSLTCGSESIPVLFQPCSLLALRAALYLPPPQAIRSTPRRSPHWRDEFRCPSSGE